MTRWATATIAAFAVWAGCWALANIFHESTLAVAALMSTGYFGGAAVYATAAWRAPSASTTWRFLRASTIGGALSAATFLALYFVGLFIIDPLLKS